MLNVLQKELRRVAVSGAGHAKGDETLTALALKLKAAGGKVPVLARLAEKTETVCAVENSNRAGDLLDEASLLMSIAYTQASTGEKDDMKSLDGHGGAVIGDSSYKKVKDLLTALTTKGAGRYNIITEAINNGYALDIRFMSLMVQALDDSYAGISNAVAACLHRFGEGVIPLIKESLDTTKGTESTIRKLRVLADILPKEEKEAFFLDVFENGHAKVKHVAVEELAGEKYDGIHSKALKSKSDEMLAAAYHAYAMRTDKNAEKIIADALAGDKHYHALNAVIETGNIKGTEIAERMAKGWIKSKTVSVESYRLTMALVRRGGGYILSKELFEMYLEPNVWDGFGERAVMYRDDYINDVVIWMLRTDVKRAAKDIIRCLPKHEWLLSCEAMMRNLINTVIEDCSQEESYDLLSPILKYKIHYTVLNAFNRRNGINTYDCYDENILKSVLDGNAKLNQLDMERRWLEYLSDVPYIAAMTIKDPDKKLHKYFEALINRKFDKLQEIYVFYWYAWAMLAMGEKDFVPYMLDVFEANILRKGFDLQDGVRGLAYRFTHGNSYTLIAWFNAILLLDPKRSVSILEKLKANVSGTQDLDRLDISINILKGYIE